MVRRRQVFGSGRGLRGLGGRPRGVWIALGAGVLGGVVAVGILVSVLGLIGSGKAATGGVLHVPAGKIALAVVLGYLVSLVLLVLTALSRSTGRAWVTAVLAAIIAVAVSVYPLFATAASAVGQAGHIVPWIADLIHRVAG